MRRSICLAACLTMLAACERPPEPSEAPAAAAFNHAATGDLSGYYLPLSETRAGPWALSHVFIGQTAEFDSWRSGPRGSTFAPVMLEFRDAAGAGAGEGAGVVERVLPTAYAVTDGRIRFEGRSSRIGRVTFEGRLDAGALATSRRNLGDEGAVLTGRLTVDDAPAQTVRLRWWAGD